jgi:hypothetical protein
VAPDSADALPSLVDNTHVLLKTRAAVVGTVVQYVRSFHCSLLTWLLPWVGQEITAQACPQCKAVGLVQVAHTDTIAYRNAPVQAIHLHILPCHPHFSSYICHLAPYS